MRTRMAKWIWVAGAAALLGAGAARAQTTVEPGSALIDQEQIKDAGNAALQELLGELFARWTLPKRFAVLPLQRDLDGGYFTMQLRNLFTTLGAGGGFELYTRQDEEWNSLLKEIRWGEENADTMDAATVQKFGRIQGVQALLMGRVTGISKGDDGAARVRINVQAFEVETGRQVWGAEKVGIYRKDAGAIGKHLAGLKPLLPYLWPVLGVLAALIVLGAVFKAVGNAMRPR